jgi:hypothetical protein
MFMYVPDATRDYIGIFMQMITLTGRVVTAE